MAEPISLVKALREYFEIPADKMVAEFKALSAEDKDDFVQMFADIGIEVTRTTA